MKKLDRFILKSFIILFFGILIVVVFILMMQFLWLYIDELVGKGLSLKVISEFLFWGCSTMLPIAIPLATLLSAVMTIGKMSENNELIAIKSAGISLQRVMFPLSITAVIICVAAFFAGNNLVPVAFNEIYTLRDDIGRTKDEINIPTGTFYDGIDGYILRIEDKNKETGMMYGVMVYDHTSSKGNTSISLADSAIMKMSAGKNYLNFLLFNGVNYNENNTKTTLFDMTKKTYRDTTFQLDKIEFRKQDMIIPLENYAFQKSDQARFDDQVKTKTMKHLALDLDTNRVLLDSTLLSQKNKFRQSRYVTYANQLDTAQRRFYDTPFDISLISTWRSTAMRKQAYEKAATKANDLQMRMKEYNADIYQYNWLIVHSAVELLKKIAQAIACLVLFFIGAPLGSSVTKKSGLGSSLIIAALFFVLYWVVDITGTKLANDGAVEAAIGVFTSTIILLPIGLYMSWKAIRDESVFKTENFSMWWKKLKSKFFSFFRKTRIVYMGTPEFAVAPLDALIKANYNVVGVVTVADKPSGRGLKVNESAVKKYAVEHGIPVLQPVKLKDPEFLEQLAAFKADLFVVVAFRMLPEVVWSMPKLGTFNLHAALLPQYRGAAPINWAVINGERITGVTTFMIDKDIDTGGIMLRQDVRIGPNETAGELHDKLMPIGADLVVQTVEGIIERTVETRMQRSFIQGSEVLKSAPKLTKELCHIDWNAPTNDVFNLIRGLSPYPAAFTEIYKEGSASIQLKIYRAEKVDLSAAPGTILTDGKTYLAIATADGAISLKDIQLSGKKRMDVGSFLLGFRDCESYKTC